MKNKITKIGILLTKLNGLDTRALKYIVLHQNTLQESFEFQFYPPPSDSVFLAEIDAKGPLDRNHIEKMGEEFFPDYKKYLKLDAQSYGLDNELPDIFVILSTVAFKDNYYMTGGDGWDIVALGNWERHMSPPSIVEFFVSLLVHSAIDAACDGKWPSRHYSTKGCSFDFTANISDARFGVLSGYICQSCSDTISDATSENVVKDVKLLLGKSWVGDATNPSDVANTAKKLGYDLFHTSGVKQTMWEKISSTVEQEVVKNMIKIVGSVVLAVLLLWLGLKK